MWIYHQVSRFAPAPVARIVTALWYAALITLVIFCAFEPQASFRYGNI